MILYLTIAIIIWLALACVYFINEARKQRDRADSNWQGAVLVLHELQKYKRPRDSKGRFK